MGFIEWIIGKENIRGEPMCYVMTEDPTLWCLKCHRILLKKKELKRNICDECYGVEEV